ncbi:hypothetical protein CSAL01_08472 [Colletotrichum salicis]|uniref:Uncharacterized protein n=1 Tax=Colletotrichum salicis TaxID=1209931 RepID=A0A135UHH1_9PEZI|nr:hypothetical protein CSAL01_08472 [Colletotrichum salicis]
MGPLMDSSNPLCLRPKKSSCAWSKYMKGASLVFAWRISQGLFTTVLTPPPPERLHPDGLTNWQDTEEPVLKGRLGTPTSCGILLVHSNVQGAQNFRYQVWPLDYTDQWLNKFEVSKALTHTWRTISKSRAHTSWAVTTGELLESADAIKISKTCKAQAVSVAITTSKDDSISPEPSYFLRSQRNKMPQIRLNGETELATPQIIKTSDAETQTIQISSPGSQIVKDSIDEILSPAPEYWPQSQQSICQTEANVESIQAVSKISQTSDAAINILDSSYTPQSQSEMAQTQAKGGTIQVDRPRAPAKDPSFVTEALSVFLVCLHLAIIEMTLSLLLLLMGTIAHLPCIPGSVVKIKDTKTAYVSPDDDSACQAAPVDLEAAEKERNRAIKQALRKARVALQSGMAIVAINIDELIHDDKFINETKAASITCDTADNFPAPSITWSGMDFATFCPTKRMKNKEKKKKKKKSKDKIREKDKVAIITAEHAHFTVFTEPMREDVHSCLGPVDSSTLRKACWVDRGRAPDAASLQLPGFSNASCQVTWDNLLWKGVLVESRLIN